MNGVPFAPPAVEPSPPPPPRALCLAGPTAAGKTAAALAIAAAFAMAGRPVEIVSVDSGLVYRALDIGTAKPTAAERARVPHHLIDVIDPAEAYSAARFVADATRLAGEIAARGALPLLVGGTMLYFKALFDGLDAMPAADAAVRAALDAQRARDGLAALHRELQAVDPVTAARLQPGDAQRIQRALEVFRIGGRPLSSFHSGHDVKPRPPAFAAPLISLEPADRGWLHDRITQRFAQMLADGLVDEVRALAARGDLHAGLPSMRCVGYRQTWQALFGDGDGGPPPKGADADVRHRLAQLPERGIAATRQLAKRQLTWLRGMPQRLVVACDEPDATARVVALAGALVSGEPVGAWAAG